MSTNLVSVGKLKAGDRVLRLMGDEPKALTVMKVETITYVTYSKKDALPIKVAHSGGDAVYVES